MTTFFCRCSLFWICSIFIFFHTSTCADKVNSRILHFLNSEKSLKTGQAETNPVCTIFYIVKTMLKFCKYLYRVRIMKVILCVLKKSNQHNELAFKSFINSTT